MSRRKPAIRGVFAGLLGLIALSVAPGVASAANPTIINTGTGCSGQTAWLVSCAAAGETNNGGNIIRVSVLTSHDADKTIASLIFDEDWDGTIDPTTVKGVSPERASIASGYPRSRINYSYQFPTSNTGMSCGFLSGTRRTDNRNARIQARDSAGQTSGTSSSVIKFTAAGQCNGVEDFAYLYAWGGSNFNKDATPGQSVSFTYTGDDPDTTGNSDFHGISWRWRNLRTGGVTGETLSCPGNGDNASKTLTVNAPNRGAYVLEAELRTGGGCGQDQNSDYWFPIGTVDVNSSSIPAPTVTATDRPTVNGNVTVTVDPPTDPDSGSGGGPQIIQWDLDRNTTNGVDGFETDSVAGEGAIFSTNQTRTVNTTGLAPGVYTVRARVIDNGAMDAADSIRRTSSIATDTFRVDAPPNATNSSASTETQTPVVVPLNATDSDGDALTYNVTSGPSIGTLSGTGNSRTYTPDAGFSGTDSFTFQASDPYGGTDTATVTITVTPDTTIDAGPSGTQNSRGAHFEFSSRATGATFECSLDGSAFSPCSSPQDFTDLPDGPHTFEVRAVAGALTDTTPASRTFTVSATPSVTITSGPSGVINQDSGSFEFTASENGNTQPLDVECKLDEAPFADCSSPYPFAGIGDGEHTFTVRATDQFGKTGSDSRTFTIDTVAPETTIDSGPSGPTNDPSPTFTFSSDEGGSTFECSVDGGAFTSCSSPRNTGPFAEGQHTFEVRATDQAGNTDQTPASRTFTVDLTDPETTIDSGPADGSFTTDPTPTFGFSSNESGSSFECSVDGGAYEPCTSPETTETLSDGQHTFRVRAVDHAGNRDQTPAARTFNVDTGPPDTSVVGGPADGATTADNTPTFDFSASESPVTYECSIDGAAFTPCSDPYTTPTLGDGSHTIEVRATDAAGNSDLSPASRTFTVDTTGPDTTIDSGPDPLINQNSATFTFSASEGNVTFECSLDGGPYQSCSSPETVSGLSQGSHTFRVRALDAVGNPDPTPAEQTFVVDTVDPDTTITAGPSGPTPDNTPTFEFTSNEPNSTFECSVDGGNFQSCSSPFTTGQLADGPHVFEVRATDPAGNTDPSPATRNFNVDTQGSETTITSGPPAVTNQTSATFTYTSDEAPLVTYECSLDNAAFSPCLPTGQTYTGLSEGVHTFRVRSVDLLGNPDPTPASYTWRIDTTPPQTTIDDGPGGPTADNTPTFEFSSSEQNSTFECRFDNAAFQPCSSPHSPSAPLSDGQHTFEVRATDQAGNTDQSPASRTFSVDTTPPETSIDFGPTGTTTDNQPTFTFSSSEPNSTFECSVDNAGFTPCTSPFTTQRLDDGQHSFRVRATDALGNRDQSPAERTFTVDATGPDTTITDGPTGQTNSSSATFEFESDEANTTFQCSLDNATFTSCSSPQTYNNLSEGSHTFRVRAIDSGGNIDQSPASRTWTVDTTAPQTTITGGPSGPTADPTPTFTFTSNSPGSTFECRVDGGTFEPCTSPHTTQSLSQGQHTFEVRATDQAGNTDQTPDSRTFTVDTAPPNTTITGGPAGPTADNTPTFDFTSSEPNSTFQCRIDSEDFEACTSPYTAPALGDGQHSFQVRAIDSVGNVDQSPAVRNFSVDTTGPETTINSGPSGLHNSSTAGFTFSADELGGTTFQCSLDNAPFTSCSSPQTYNSLSEGSHTFRVRAVDALGNPDPTPAQRAFTVDTIAPQTTVNTGPSGPTNDNTPTFTFSSEANATFECRIDPGAFQSCTSPFTPSQLGDGQHTFEVRATDQAGNTDQTPGSRTFTVDTAAPETNFTDGPSGPTADNTPTFQFASPDGTATFQCRVDSGTFTACTSPHTTSTLSDGSHTVEVRAVDPAGNADASPASRSIVVDTTPAQTTIDGGPAGPTTDTTPTFDYSSNEANSTFECRIDSEAFAPCSSGSFTAPELGDGSHTFQVRATDPLGNQDQTPASRSFSVDTMPPDTTLDSTPPSLSNSSSATFTFSASEGNVTFECSLDGATFGPCSSPQTLTGLSDGSHTFRVRALDALGNTDQSSAAYTWTIDTVAPQTSINFGPQGSTSNSSPTFGFSSSQGGSTFECRIDSNAFGPCTSPHNTGTLAPGAHTFQVRATDPAGNTDASPASRAFTVDPNGPSTQIESGPDGMTADNTPTFTFSSTKPNSTFECFIDGGAGFDCASPHTVTPPLADGDHTFEVQATDASGNTDPVPAAATFTVDATAPETTIDSAPDPLTNEDDATITFSSNDNGATFECSLDGGAYEPCSSPLTEENLDDGSHTVRVRAVDGVGNRDQTPAEATFEVDDTAPSTTINSGPSGTTTNDRTPTFTFSAEDGATFACRMDSDNFTPCNSGSFTASELGDGQHTFEVRATDEAGNTQSTPASSTFTVDGTSPETTIDSATVAGNDLTVNFSSSEAGSTFECAIDGGAFTGCTSPKTYEDLSEGQHTVQVRATDQNGNTDASPASREVTVDPAPDTTAPETTIDSGTVNGKAATFTFSSSEQGSTFTCRLDGGAAEACTSPKTYDGLAPGEHTLAVVATDAAGNADPTAATRTVTVEEDEPLPQPRPGPCANPQNGTGSGETLRGTSFGDFIRGGGGADRIFGLGARDCLNGGPGGDTVNGGTGADTLRSGRGGDTVTGGPGSDRIFTDGESDVIRARDGVRDVINCGRSKDTVFADRRDQVAGNCETVKP